MYLFEYIWTQIYLCGQIFRLGFSCKAEIFSMHFYLCQSDSPLFLSIIHLEFRLVFPVVCTVLFQNKFFLSKQLTEKIPRSQYLSLNRKILYLYFNNCNSIFARIHVNYRIWKLIYLYNLILF